MDWCLGELIGVGIMLCLALIVAIKVLVEEISEEIEDYKRRNHWRRWTKRR